MLAPCLTGRAVLAFFRGHHAFITGSAYFFVGSLVSSAVYEYLRYTFLCERIGTFSREAVTFPLASSTIVPAGLLCTGQGLACVRAVSTCVVNAEAFTKNKHDLAYS